MVTIDSLDAVLMLIFPVPVLPVELVIVVVAVEVNATVDFCSSDDWLVVSIALFVSDVMEGWNIEMVGIKDISVRTLDLISAIKSMNEGRERRRKGKEENLD